jgi:UDP-N-acetylglucosamine:LPS N-acetylglucosamine transferase
VIADPDLTADGLAAEVANLLGDAPRRAAMAAAMRGAARPEAARAVAEALLELAVAPS